MSFDRTARRIALAEMIAACAREIGDQANHIEKDAESLIRSERDILTDKVQRFEGFSFTQKNVGEKK